MNETINVEPINTKEIIAVTKESETLVSNLDKWHIENQLDYNQADTYLKLVKSKLKELDEKEKSVTSTLNIAKKAVIDLFRKPKEMLQNIEHKIKSEMITFTDKMEAEARKQEEELRKKMEQKAQKAEDKGDLEKADLLRRQADVTTVSSTIEKPKGILFTENWYAVVIDEKKVPREYLCIDQKKLDAIARATKGSISIDGVQFKMEKIVKSRG